MTSQSTSQPSQQTGNFIVKVKLLTNQTYQITTHPDTLISQFKKLVQEKTKVPVDRQKIVFGGKSLIDEKPLKQYIHQSGLTVHLIAKSTPPPNTNPQGNIQPPQPPQTNNNSQSNNNNQQPNMNLINPFANLLGAIQNPPSDPNQFSLNIGNAVNSLFGNLGNANGIGIRVVHGTVNGQPIVNNSQAQTSNQNNQTNPQPQSNPSQNNVNQSNPINSPPTNNTNNNPTNPIIQPIPQNQNNNQSQNSNQPHTSPHQHQHQHQHQNNHSFPPPPPPPHLHQFNYPNLGPNQNPNNHRLFGPLQQLQVSLNRVNNPYSLGQGSSLQQTTINYLKRMQSQMLRTAAQLNRNIHMLQEGQYMQLTELIPVFEALSNANLTAIDLIHRNQHQNNRMNNSLFAQNRQNINQNINNQNNQNNPINNNNTNNSADHRQMPEITATIIIEEQNVQINDENPNVFENLFRNQNFILNQMNRQPSNQQQSNNQQQSANNQQHLLNNSQPSNNTQPFNNPQPAVNQQTTQPKPNNQQNNNNNQHENNIRNPNPPQPQTQTTQQPNVMNLLGNAMNSNGGFNFANIFAPQRPNNQNTFNMTSSNTNFQNPSNPQQLAPNPFNNINPLSPPNQQNPLNALQGINFMNLFNDNSNIQQPPQNPLQNNQNNQQNQPNQPNQSNQPNQPQNPLQGINIMGMLGNLQQGGGIGSLLGMSIGSMLQQQGQDPTIYSAILSPISGGQIMGCFTQKDFSFISRKRQQFRDSILRAISIAGSRQDLINKYTDDLQNLLIPRQNISRAEICKSKVKKIIHRYVQKIVTNFLHYASEQDLTEVIMGDIKRLYCESIDQISKHTDNLEQVFSNMKTNVVTELDKIAPGLSGMFYSIVERDLIRVYNDYETQKKRKQAQSQQQAKDEADLLSKIQQASKQDVAYMSTYEHSKFYPQTKKQE